MVLAVSGRGRARKSAPLVSYASTSAPTPAWLAEYYENRIALLTSRYKQSLDNQSFTGAAGDRVSTALVMLALASAEQTLDAIQGVVQQLHAGGKGQAQVALGAKG